MSVELRLPADFAEYAHEVEAKGWFPATFSTSDGSELVLTFYDPVRLIQDVADEIAAGRQASFERLVVLDAVTPDQMAAAIARLPSTFFE